MEWNNYLSENIAFFINLNFIFFPKNVCLFKIIIYIYKCLFSLVKENTVPLLK